MPTLSFEKSACSNKFLQNVIIFAPQLLTDLSKNIERKFIQRVAHFQVLTFGHDQDQEIVGERKGYSTAQMKVLMQRVGIRESFGYILIF